LVLSHTDVSDEAIATLAGIKSLTTLSLNGTKATKGGVEKLRAALPKCIVDWEQAPKK
jgi:hypothetical protein